MEVASGKTQVKPFVSNLKSPGRRPMGKSKREAIHRIAPTATISKPKRINQRAIELKSGIGFSSYMSGSRAWACGGGSKPKCS
jgi:hypothetical protein